MNSKEELLVPSWYMASIILSRITGYSRQTLSIYQCFNIYCSVCANGLDKFNESYSSFIKLVCFKSAFVLQIQFSIFQLLSMF